MFWADAQLLDVAMVLPCLYPLGNHCASRVQQVIFGMWNSKQTTVAVYLSTEQIPKALLQSLCK